MSDNLEGISAETVAAVQAAILANHGGSIMAEAAITALLASGEVVLRKDVEELVSCLTDAQDELKSLDGQNTGEGYNEVDTNVMKVIAAILTKFTKGAPR